MRRNELLILLKDTSGVSIKPSELYVEVTRRVMDKESSNLIDEDAVKRGQDWSVLANQVVGAEIL